MSKYYRIEVVGNIGTNHNIISNLLKQYEVTTLQVDTYEGTKTTYIAHFNNLDYLNDVRNLGVVKSIIKCRPEVNITNSTIDNWVVFIITTYSDSDAIKLAETLKKDSIVVLGINSNIIKVFTWRRVINILKDMNIIKHIEEQKKIDLYRPYKHRFD